ncbi:MAG: FAD-binding oxidoreductase [Deltaproteobacteria bacterium]|nr:MAG: FAD-binding oxidoreductase [Deltaproteobacteria bacterium]
MADRSAVLIGGGITGALTARELAKAGWKVTLLEGAHVGAGSSSRTAAGIRQQWSTPETVRGMRYAVRFYEQFVEEVDDHTPVIVQKGYLFLHGTEERWAAAKERVQMQQAVGLTEVEALERDELVKRFPYVSPEACVGGTFCPTDGFLLPHLVYQEAARRARNWGAEIVQGAWVTGATHENGRLTEVISAKGRFGADLFVDCTNAWARRTAEILEATELPVDPLKRYLWFIQKSDAISDELFAQMPLVISPSGVYCRPENADTLMMGHAHDTMPDFDFDMEDQDEIEPLYAHDGGIDAEPFASWMQLAEALPPVGEFNGIAATTSGYYGSTPDHNPFLGYDPKVSNLMRLVGFSGHGAMFGPFTALVAKALAEAGADVDTVDVDGEDVSLEAFALDRELGEAETMVI